MNQIVLERLRSTAYRTIRILKEIEKGQKSPQHIADRVGCTRALANYYLRAVGVKAVKLYN